MPQFAANLSMLFNEVPFLDRFAAAHDAGFDAVEFLFPYAHSAEEVAGRLQDNNLTQVLFNAPPGDWDGGERGIAALPDRVSEFRDSIGLALDYARALDCKTLHVMAGLVADGANREAMLSCYIDNVRYAADQCIDAGITVALEPLNVYDVPGYLVSRLNQIADVIEQVGRPNVGIQFDFYHVQIMQGDLARHFEQYFDLTAHVQIAGVPERHEPNTGEVNFAYLFQLMDRLGYNGHVGCEYRPRGNTVDGLSWLFD
jgi:2-dehydrotetronate isomerase